MKLLLLGVAGLALGLLIVAGGLFYLAASMSDEQCDSVHKSLDEEDE